MLQNSTLESIREAINEIDQIFNLVLISEKLDESLILMKDLLCWNDEDIVYLVKNARKESTKKTMSLLMRKNLIEYNMADGMLYDHFLQKHEEAVRKYGVKKMVQQVKNLNLLRDEMLKTCDTSKTNSFQSYQKDEFSNIVNQYEINTDTKVECLLLMKTELNTIQKIRDNQGRILAAHKLNI